MKNFHWTVLVLTCSTSKKAAVFKKELQLLQKKGVIDSRTALLTVEDPEKNIGSGGATLNAILVVTEYLSARRGFSVLNGNVLDDSWILIIHNGRSYPYDSCSKGFIPLRDSPDSSGTDTNLHNLLQVMSKLSCDDGQQHAPGVWVCSADAYLRGDASIRSPPGGSHSDDCIIYSVPASAQYGTSHGVLKLEPGSNRVADILYCRTLDDVSSCSLGDGDSRVALVCGVAFLSAALAETLLSLHTRGPIGSCTYLGQDSGNESLQISLFFDLLSAMATGIKEADFLAGECGKTYGSRHSYKTTRDSSTRVRSLVWKELRRYRMSTVMLDEVEYLYWNDLLPAKSHITLLRRINGRATAPQDGRGLITSIASSLRHVTTSNDDPESTGVIQHSLLHGTHDNPITVGRNSFISNVNLKIDNLQSGAKFSDNIAYIQIRLRPNSDTILLHFGVDDDLLAHYDRSTIYNIPWQLFFQSTGIRPEDVWDDSVFASERRLSNAKLFPINCDVTEIWWLKESNLTSQALDTWRKQKRLSIEAATEAADLESDFAFRRESFAEVVRQTVRDILLGYRDGSPLPPFKLAATEGWSDLMFDTLDELILVPGSDRDPGTAARILANVANLLGCLAAGEGGLRSGPAANREWNEALSILEGKEEGSIAKGVRCLKYVRNVWLDTPHRMVRAARHYEAASQILIRHAVSSADKFVSLRQNPLPDFGVWVKCECAARVDLAGGWTDTPPICYQLGGSVVNASIMVDEKRPIGARVSRTSAPEIVCTLDNDLTLRLSTVNDLLDYNVPSSAGALLKACLVYAGVVDTGSGETLADQLLNKYGGGFELHTWSDLPQGSGLGTSSIMAGAILAAVYVASGRLCDRHSLVHAVLCVEQLMTTGGGWQDQVGGLMGGILQAHSSPNLPLKVDIKRVVVPAAFAAILQRHLVLIHTGKVRLAKNLLQGVLRNWFARDDQVLDTFEGLHRLSARLAEALEAENLAEIGLIMDEYWQLKKILAPSVEPAQVAKVMSQLRPHVHGQLLCGAGGGGFMLVLTKQPDCQNLVFDLIEDMQVFGFSLHRISFDDSGLVLSIGNNNIDIDIQ